MFKVDIDMQSSGTRAQTRRQLNTNTVTEMASGSSGSNQGSNQGYGYYGRWQNKSTHDDRKTTESHLGREDRADRIWRKVYDAEAREHEVKNTLMKLQVAPEAGSHHVSCISSLSHVALMKFEIIPGAGDQAPAFRSKHGTGCSEGGTASQGKGA